MPDIRTKHKKMKVQFTLTPEVESIYRSNREMAKKIDATLGFQDDFNKWFLIENRKAEKSLTEMLNEIDREEPEQVSFATVPDNQTATE